MALAK